MSPEEPTGVPQVLEWFSECVQKPPKADKELAPIG